MNNIIKIVEGALALAGYKIMDVGEDCLVIRNSAQDRDFHLTLTQEAS